MAFREVANSLLLVCGASPLVAGAVYIFRERSRDDSEVPMYYSTQIHN
jgi:hypothetical protein